MVAALEGGHTTLSAVFGAIVPVGGWAWVVGLSGWVGWWIGASTAIKGATPTPHRTLVITGMD